MDQRLEVFTVPATATMIEAAERIEENRARAVIVVDETGKAVAVLSEGDIMRALLKGIDVHAPVLDVARLQFRHLSERDLGEALRMMRQHGLSLVPVVDSELRVVDVITLPDVMQHVSLGARADG